ncbi:GH1 family beta-glucosidase [Actinospica sp.]|jgi:beta-glucosidase|uniref:GH1 family beta-glucosidase n=1 Tax=Actinospica sp. TaxID=1872142 RepID=UPI002C4A39CC|nr:GH1 family beta-glucosidase [Actinospica sp.]HWG25371.1 GH1 family beta-glucosidase [Actinospica sp.]
MVLPQFPAGFRWGVSTAAYQIEGAVHEDGRGPSIWDTFAHTEGRVKNGDTGDVACDHYHRWPEDVALMAELGIDTYRFSIAWPRIRPTGSGPANVAGLDFYDRLVDGLLERGIRPLPTLFHWDLPQALQDLGGWMNRETAFRFADYAAVTAARLGDRVKSWITLNEPIVHLSYGYAFGMHAPGEALMFDALPAAHHQLLAHGLTVPVLRAYGAEEILISNNCTPVRAASESAEDVAAAEIYDAFHNRLFNDPILLGTYPDLSAVGLPNNPVHVKPGDLDIISTRIDGLGVNYYNPTLIAAADAAATGLPFDFREIEGVVTTAFGWPVVPEGLTELLVGLKARYGDALPPITITENGCSTADEPGVDGAIHDVARIDYLYAHISALHEAMAAGVDVRGYLTWSLLDNFEWAEGYDQRFGLVRTDFETLKRTPKDSYHWFQSALIAQNKD